jgi:hypothetical protein
MHVSNFVFLVTKDSHFSSLGTIGSGSSPIGFVIVRVDRKQHGLLLEREVRFGTTSVARNGCQERLLHCSSLCSDFEHSTIENVDPRHLQ